MRKFLLQMPVSDGTRSRQVVLVHGRLTPANTVEPSQASPCIVSCLGAVHTREWHGRTGGLRSHDQSRRHYLLSRDQNWLLFLRHSLECDRTAGDPKIALYEDWCERDPSCAISTRMWNHIQACSDRDCTYKAGRR